MARSNGDRILECAKALASAVEEVLNTPRDSEDCETGAVLGEWTECGVCGGYVECDLDCTLLPARKPLADLREALAELAKEDSQ